jgi:hypothetical protein
MKLIQGNWVRVLAWSLVALLIVFSYTTLQHADRDAMERLHPYLRKARLREEKDEKELAAERAKFAKQIREGKTNQVPPLWPGPNCWHSPSRMAADMTEAQKADLAKKFAEKFQPTLEKWFAAYEGHIPFKADEVTLDTFESAFGSRTFTFAMGDRRLSFLMPWGTNQTVRVSSFTIRNAGMTFSGVSSDGTAANPNLPVTTGEVIRMVRADSGVEFKPSEVIIRPMVKAGALDGGEWVQLLPTGADPENFLNYKISMVFDADGKLVEYGRDPAF